VGEPGCARHGGGQAWVPGTYDPETNLYIFSTGNPTPAYTTGTRGEGDNLFTCALVAVNVDTGKMAWYFPPRHMTCTTTTQHKRRFSSTECQREEAQAAAYSGAQRLLLYVGSRDRRTPGDQQVGNVYELVGPLDQVGRAATRREEGCYHRRLAGVANFGRHHELGADHILSRYRAAVRGRRQRLFDVYLTDVDPRFDGPGGKEEDQVGTGGSFLTAIDYRTGEVAWRRPYYRKGGGGGLLSTAGRLLFGQMAPATWWRMMSRMESLCGTRASAMSPNAPQTFMLDGHQYLIAATGDQLWAFTLYKGDVRVSRISKSTIDGMCDGSLPARLFMDEFVP